MICRIKEFYNWVDEEEDGAEELLNALNSDDNQYDYWYGYYKAFQRVQENLVPALVRTDIIE